MSIDKPEIPSVELPETWGGTQTPYNESQIANGYEEAVPQIVDGGNVNYEKRGLFENLKYLRKIVDAITNMPIGKVLTVDDNNKLVYETQIRDDTVVHKDGTETITGQKTIETTNEKTLNLVAKDVDTSYIPLTDVTQAVVSIQDVLGNIMGYIFAHNLTNGEQKVGLQARRVVDGVEKYASINCGVNSRGEPYTSAITPANTSNSSSIATTAWTRTNTVTGIDTSSSIARTVGTTYTATRNCWVYHNENANEHCQFYVDGKVVYRTEWHSGVTQSTGSALVFVKKGQKWKAENGKSVTEYGCL